MSENTLRRPGRPRKTEVAQDPTSVAEQATTDQDPTPVVEQPQIHYTIAKLTPHMLSGEIHRLYEEGEDLTPVHQVSNAIQGSGKTEQTTHAQPDHELKTAVEAAKSSQDKPRTFAVAYRNPRGTVKVAHGTQFSNGHVEVETGHGVISGFEDALADLHETAKKYHSDNYHIGYTDEP